MTTHLARGARRAAALLLLALPLQACDGDGGEPRGTYDVDRVEVEGQVWTELPVVLYEGPVVDDDGVQYRAREELREARLELRSGGSYELTGRYALVSLDGDFAGFTETARETGTFEVDRGRIFFYPDQEPLLDPEGWVDGDEVTVGVADPLFGVTDLYTFRR